MEKKMKDKFIATGKGVFKCLKSHSKNAQLQMGQKVKVQQNTITLYMSSLTVC